jgi:hypothetical protein
MELVLKIAAGILLASAILFVANTMYINYVAHELARSIQEVADAEKTRVEAQQKQRHDREVAKARREIVAKDRRAAQRDIEREKELAWESYYQQSNDCLSFKSEEHMIECGNARIRARKLFDKGWRNGTLRN